MQNIEIWKFLGGVGLFLYGMSLLEAVLKNSSGRSLKLFLKKHTKSLFKSILGGSLITSVVQSSTVVSLIVLAFVETGIITFRNAMGVLLGANVGTTMTGWLVVMIGFKLDVITYAMPLIAISAIGKFLLEKRRNLNNLFSVFFSLGMLFLGLGYMKEGGQLVVQQFNITPYTNHGSFIFVLIGFVLTAIIQSSSATVAIALTALHTNVINFPSAAALVIGSEIGTTLTILFWGVKGSADKKRTAWGNFGFNVFLAVISYIFLPWIIYFVENIIGVTDSLVGLAFFQTTINVFSIILFIPLLGIFSKWLERKFNVDTIDESSYISKNLPLLPVLATDALKNEIIHLLEKIRLFNQKIIYLSHSYPEDILETLKSFTQIETNIEEEYLRLKHTEGDILEYYTKIQEQSLGKEDTQTMLPYIAALRHVINAAKAIKDVAHNFKEFEASVNDILREQSAIIRKQWFDFDKTLQNHLCFSDTAEVNACLETILAEEEVLYGQTILQLKTNQLTDIEASTLLNVHHEIKASKKSLLLALAILQTENGYIRQVQ